MDLRVNQEIPCSIRECHQKHQRGVCSFCFTFNSLSLSSPLSLRLCRSPALPPSLSLFLPFSLQEHDYSRFQSVYDLFIVVFSPSPWMYGREDRKLWTRVQSNVYLGHTFFAFLLRALCVCAPSPSLFWEVVWWLGRLLSSPPRSSLKWGISGVPRSKGRAERERKVGEGEQCREVGS